MAKPWFDPNTGDLLFDDYVATMPSYQRVLEDARVSPGEVEEQADRVLELLKQLDAALTPDARDLATDVLCELAVLNDLQFKLYESRAE
jgi:hypothetical protein